jgi:hypothetical protein
MTSWERYQFNMTIAKFGIEQDNKDYEKQKLKRKKY